MKKNKVVKVLFIALFSIAIICTGVLSYLFIFKSSEEENPQKDDFFVDRYYVAQTAIFNDEYSHNFNGIYKFSRINFLHLSKLSSETQSKIFDKYKVNDTMSLIKHFTKLKNADVKNFNETLLIDDGYFQINHNGSPNFIGTIKGTDDYSVVFDANNKTKYTVSLTNLVKEDLENISIDETVKYFGDELYLSTTLEIVIDDISYNLDAVYVYKITK